MSRILITSTFFCLLGITINAQSLQSDTSTKTERVSKRYYWGKLKLNQNYPNPFTANQVTTIKYRAVDVTHVTIIVYDINYNKVLMFDNLPSETGIVTIEANDLAPGTYTYALVINGRIIEKKKMICIKSNK